jgi:hypothetical protein
MNIIRPNFRKAPTTFIVEVTFDAECAMWVGVCDALCIATEAATFEALCDRVWLVAEDGGHENGLSVDLSDMQLVFQHQEIAGQRAVG